MYNRIGTLLEKAGLNESEATMFQRILHVPESLPLKDVITECRMSEFTGYQAARKLAQRGFVEIQKKGSLKFIQANSVERIARSVGKEQRKLKRLELQLMDIAKYQQGGENKEQGKRIEVREGKEAFLEAYDSLPERTHGELLGFGSLTSVWQVTEADYFSSYEREWINRRTRRGVKAVLIDSEASVVDAIRKKAKQEMRDVRLLSNEIESNQWTVVADKEAYVFETRPPTPVVIAVKDSILVNMLKRCHQMLWSLAYR